MESNKLERMGFVEGEAVETILTTLSEEMQPNAAPMGVWVQPESTLVIRPYEDSQTAHNILQNGEAIINITHNPRIFLAMAFKKELPRLERPVFESAEKVKVPRLQGMDGYLEVKVKPKQSENKAPQFKEFICSVQHIEIPELGTIVHSRARCAAIECVIHATRIRALYKDDTEATRHLVNQIDALQALVERIAPRSPSAAVIQTVFRLLSRWR